MGELQIFDALSPHIEDALRMSIRKFGVLVPVIHDQHGRIIDGHHRTRIAEEEGVGIADPIVVQVSDDEDAREIARTVNADRRHLTEEQRHPIEIELRREGHSVRAIAGALGVGKSTVADDLARLSAAGQLEQPDRVKSLDGRSRPATQSPRPEPVPVASSDADLLNGQDWAPAPPPTLAPAFQPEPPAPRPMPAPPALTPEEREERIRLVAKQSHLNAYSGAVDGLIALESYAAAYTPPVEIPGQYPALPAVIRRIEAVLSTWKNWNATR